MCGFDPFQEVGDFFADIDPGPAIGEVLADIDPGPALGSALAGLDDLVGDIVPGGWGTIAKIALTSVGVPAPISNGLVTVAEGVAKGLSPEQALLNGVKSGAITYGFGELQQLVGNIDAVGVNNVISDWEFAANNGSFADAGAYFSDNYVAPAIGGSFDAFTGGNSMSFDELVNLSGISDADAALINDAEFIEYIQSLPDLSAAGINTIEKAITQYLDYVKTDNQNVTSNTLTGASDADIRDAYRNVFGEEITDDWLATQRATGLDKATLENAYQGWEDSEIRNAYKDVFGVDITDEFLAEQRSGNLDPAALTQTFQDLKNKDITLTTETETNTDNTTTGDTGTTIEDVIENTDNTTEAQADEVDPIATPLIQQLTADVERYEAAGMERDEALSQAIADLAAQTGIDQQEIIAQITAGDAALYETLQGIQQDLAGSIDDLGGQITTLGTDLGGQINDLAAELGLTKQELADKIAAGDQSILDALGVTQQELANQIAAGDQSILNALDLTEQNLTDFITNVQTNLGNQITTLGTDLGGQITGVYDDLSGELVGVLDNLTGQITTLGTDLEGQITTLGTDLGGQITDVETNLGGQITTLGTDLGGQITDVETNLGGQITDVGTQVTDFNQEFTDFADYTKDQDEQNRRKKEGDEMLGLLSQMASGSVKSGIPAQIDYFYDIGGESLFATPKQESLLPSPYEKQPDATEGARPKYQYYDPSGGYMYAGGGFIEDEYTIEDLYRMLGSK